MKIAQDTSLHKYLENKKWTAESLTIVTQSACITLQVL